MARVLAASLGGIPIHLWGRVTPPGTLDQLRRIAAQPSVVEHIAAMPDLHVAHAIAVGTVFATATTIVPGALGGHLGCGMSAVRLSPTALTKQQLIQLVHRWSQTIPVGDAVHRRPTQHLADWLNATPLTTGALQHVRERLGPKHLGTLGGGNHFVELGREADGHLWLLVHSGSRGLGATIAAHHLRAADAVGGELPGLSTDDAKGQACLRDVEWALAFAQANRLAFIQRASEPLVEVAGPPSQAIDVHHNFVRLEHHFGRRLLVHRKGAIAAAAGERALIPGSMGTASYIVEGLGEATSFASASHGAGRVMTRREARERIRPDRFVHSMGRVVFDPRRGDSLVEEAPAAYREIKEVLEDEVDLVRPLIRLKPLAVLKG